jgi:hypothetical protein
VALAYRTGMDAILLEHVAPTGTLPS